MGKNSLQVKIALLMIVAVVLLSAMGYLSYRSLSSIVASIHIDANPEIRLIAIRDISMDLEKADNSIRMYNITKNRKNLQPYYTTISHINEKIKTLKDESRDDEKLQMQIDSISSLIQNNIRVWNDMLSLYNDDSVNIYLNRISDKLATAQKDTLETKRNFFQRLFGRKKKTDTTAVNQKELISDLNRIEQHDSLQNEKLLAKQTRLARTNNEIRERMYNLITKMEAEVTGSIKQKADAANRLAAKTYLWLMLFTVTGTLLTIVVLFIIVRYVRKTRAYQRALERSKEEAEKLAKTKELFMANVSHELRTPVNAISGFTEQLMHQPIDRETSKMVKIIKSSSDYLVRTINDILDFSKLQTGKLTLEKTHFSSSRLLEEVQVLFEKQAEINNTRLTHFISKTTPDVLLGDPYHLKQILINLVGNAIKFTTYGEVWFSLDCLSKPGSGSDIELIVTVSDTGIGIDKDKLDVIFDDFTQAEMSTTRKFGGTGLGLSIVKKLVELHNGTISINSSKNKGTEISCHLSYLVGDKNQVEEKYNPPVIIPEEIRNLKILVVDDEEYNRQLFKTILDRWKVKFREAENGMEAIELIKSENYNIVFMDVRMPGLDGMKTTKFIRNELKKTAAEMPVIAISAACTTDDLHKYETAGMNAFLSKPFTEEMLLNTIQDLVQHEGIYGFAKTEADKTTESDGNGQINLNELYHLAGDDEQFVRQMLERFIDTTGKGLEDINDALVSGELEIVADAAHKLSPPCRHIGASTLLGYLKQIENNARDQGDRNQLKKLAGQSVREFETVKKIIHEQIANIS